ncbi:MAG: 1-deoxy-D-xylulose-5-phosphate synthase [Erysipelotrichales bacterium]|nr:1-deoxy-D-xylulose-5-phosphate synthase [Erysipelotrichales bacterium]
MFDIKDIENPEFIKGLNNQEMKQLATEIRAFLIENIAKTGGHLASNLGAVELTIALHACFNSPKDIIIYDVSHQSYTHKILTGRAKDFNTLRQFEGLSGYSSRKESEHDVFETGHSSTSVSAMAGILAAHEIDKKDDFVISVIGDAAFGNGMVFEALNFLGAKEYKKGIIILNDNKMGISKNVGSLAKMLNRLRKSRTLSRFKNFLEIIFPEFIVLFLKSITRGLKGFIQKANIFEDMGFNYLGPIDGHNIKQLIKTINLAKKHNKPAVIHVVTTKGKGFEKAELDIDGEFHGVSPDFDLDKPKDNAYISYSEIFAKALTELSENEKIYCISSAMIKGAKLDIFEKQFPERLFDVGIAEEHAATMAAGMAITGKKVFLSYYSTFSQRAYDQINHDIVRQKLPVVIGLDRAGIVGEDGYTHQGLFDLALFSHLDDCIIAHPYTINECYSVLKLAFTSDKPFFIRYERESLFRNKALMVFEELKFEWKAITKGKSLILISYGSTLKRLMDINHKYNIDALIINALFIKPLDEIMLNKLFMLALPILIVEEVIEDGSLYNHILRFKAENNFSGNLYRMNFKTGYVEHGDKVNLLKKHQLDSDSIYKMIKKISKADIES